MRTREKGRGKRRGRGRGRGRGENQGQGPSQRGRGDGPSMAEHPRGPRGRGVRREDGYRGAAVRFEARLPSQRRGKETTG